MEELKHPKSINVDQTVELKKPSEAMQSIYRGIWADQLKDGDELPVGGSLANEKLYIKIQLDFNMFDEQLKNFTQERILEGYEESKGAIVEWLAKTKSNMDPYIYYACFNVLNKINQLLDINPASPTNQLDRHRVYSRDVITKLSELKGKSACAERAALGQYLFQKIGIQSSYVSGITMNDAYNDDEFPEDHSFLVIKNVSTPDGTLVFDIARPRSEHNLPRVLKTQVPFSYDLLKGKEELLVESTEVLQGGTLWFGVGNPVAGHHNTISEKKE